MEDNDGLSIATLPSSSLHCTVVYGELRKDKTDLCHVLLLEDDTPNNKLRWWRRWMWVRRRLNSFSYCCFLCFGQDEDMQCRQWGSWCIISSIVLLKELTLFYQATRNVVVENQRRVVIVHIWWLWREDDSFFRRLFLFSLGHCRFFRFVSFRFIRKKERAGRSFRIFKKVGNFLPTRVLVRRIV